MSTKTELPGTQPPHKAALSMSTRPYEQTEQCQMSHLEENSLEQEALA
jgi:hypothetical protein